MKTLKPAVRTLANPVRTLSINPRATERLRGRAAMERRKRWLDRFPLCKHCEAEGLTTPATEVDHITPLERGGADDYESNGQSLCTRHHQAKTAREASARAGRFA